MVPPLYKTTTPPVHTGDRHKLTDMESRRLTVTPKDAICFVFLITLCVLFVQMFGRPSVTRFLLQEVTVKTSVEDTCHGNVLPAVTLCAVNPDTESGWRNASIKTGPVGWDDFLASECNATTPAQVYDCIAERTFSRDEVVLDTRIVRGGQVDSAETLVWRKDVTVTVAGNCFTLLHPKHIGTSYYTDRLDFTLNSSLKYYIFLHDPDFFLVNINIRSLAKHMIIMTGRMFAGSLSMLYS